MDLIDCLAEFEADIQLETGRRAVEYFPFLPKGLVDIVENRDNHVEAARDLYLGKPIPFGHGVILAVSGGVPLLWSAHRNKRERVRFRSLIAERVPVTRTSYEQAFGSALTEYGLDRFLSLEEENLRLTDRVFSFLNGAFGRDPENRAFVSQSSRLLRRWQDEYVAVVRMYCAVPE